MLDRSAKAFERLEEVDPPSGKGKGDDRYGDVGVVRLSLAIVDEDYRKRKYATTAHSYASFEKYLVP